MARSPRHRQHRRGWISDLPRADLHALAGKWLREFQSRNLTSREDWALDRVLAELEYRHYAELDVMKRCWCALCCEPPLTFDEGQWVDRSGEDSEFPL